jgi:hypothetical protein
MFTFELNDKNNFFRVKYIENMISRFITSSLSLEGLSDLLDDPTFALNLYYQTEALEKALSRDENSYLNPMIQCGELQDLIEIVSGEAFTSFRTTSASVVGSNVRRSEPRFIRNDLYYMFKDYNSFYPFTNEVDPVFLKEAQLHIRLLHIHPFEDGNGRVARIILIRNLLQQNKVPCIITKEYKREYCDYIENNDIVGLAKFFQKMSEKELQVMIGLYNELNRKGLILDNLMSEEQKKEYAFLCNKEIELPKNKPVFRDLMKLIYIHRDGGINNDNIIINKLVGYKHFYDNSTGDYAIYDEHSKLLIVHPKNDSRLFMIKSQENVKTGPRLIFKIDDRVCHGCEFEYELNHLEMVNEDKLYKKVK